MKNRNVKLILTGERKWLLAIGLRLLVVRDVLERISEMVLLQIVSHVGITLVAVIGLALRIEHRLTKIETEITWIKGAMNPGKKGKKDHEGNCKVGTP